MRITSSHGICSLTFEQQNPWTADIQSLFCFLSIMFQLKSLQQILQKHNQCSAIAGKVIYDMSFVLKWILLTWVKSSLWKAAEDSNTTPAHKPVLSDALTKDHGQSLKNTWAQSPFVLSEGDCDLVSPSQYPPEAPAVCLYAYSLLLSGVSSMSISESKLLVIKHANACSVYLSHHANTPNAENVAEVFLSCQRLNTDSFPLQTVALWSGNILTYSLFVRSSDCATENLCWNLSPAEWENSQQL